MKYFWIAMMFLNGYVVYQDIVHKSYNAMTIISVFCVGLCVVNFIEDLNK